MESRESPSTERINGVRMAVDVGKVRVGLAACDAAGILPSPVDTLKRDPKRGIDQRILVRKALERDAVRIYVGYPVNLQGRDTASTEDAVRYAEQLAAGLAKAGSTAEVRLIDERLSTVSATRQLHASGRSTRTHRSVIDQAAAVEILQHALDMEQSLGKDIGRAVTPPPEAESTEGTGTTS